MIMNKQVSVMNVKRIDASLWLTLFGDGLFTETILA